MNAKQVLEKYWDERTPVDPVSIARAAITKIIIRSLDKDDPAERDLSGMAKFEKETGYFTIAYNTEDSLVRQRFTLAHELGHIMLKHIDINANVIAFRDFKKTYEDYDIHKEYEANKFAAELLMPVESILRLKAVNINIVEALASAMYVSEEAMRHRLKNLGL